jgi:hypothetical protein
MKPDRHRFDIPRDRENLVDTDSNKYKLFGEDMKFTSVQSEQAQNKDDEIEKLLQKHKARNEKAERARGDSLESEIAERNNKVNFAGMHRFK